MINLVGKRFGRTWITKTKTLEGLLAELCINLIIAYLILGNLVIILVMAFTATLVETLVDKLDDNLIIPLFAGFNGQLALYILAPNARITIKHAIWGALFATFSWQLVSLGFSYYVNTLSHYSATYGSLGTVIVLMIWFYMTGIIIIMGGVINATILHYRK